MSQSGHIYFVPFVQTKSRGVIHMFEENNQNMHNQNTGFDSGFQADNQNGSNQQSQNFAQGYHNADGSYRYSWTPKGESANSNDKSNNYKTNC